MQRPSRFALAAGLLMGAASTGLAREARLPLTVEPPLIREVLMRQVFSGPDKRAVFWGEPGSCNYFYLEDPKVEAQVSRLRIVAHGEARLGAELGDGCLSPVVWSGHVEIFERPGVEGYELHFDVVDSNILDERGQKEVLVGQLWDRIKESIQPRFASVVVDLAEPFSDLREFVASVASPDRAAEARRTLDSMRLLSATVLPKGVVVEAGLEVAEAAPPTPPGPEPPLGETEMQAFTERANQWDAFVTFVVRTLGAKTLRRETRNALLETLLDARYQIVQTLEHPVRQPDSVRQLFVKSWERLRPVAGEVASQLPGAEAMHVLTFVAAGDALGALDQIGPSFGIEVSADGLRRMARMIEPDEAEDPLDFATGVDPALRREFGFPAIPEEPAPPPEEPTPTAPPEPSPPLTPEPSPSVTLEPTAVPDMPAPTPGATSWWSDWWQPRAAFAATAEIDRSKDWKGWVVGEGDLNAYLRRVGELLRLTAARTIERQQLSGVGAEVYRKLLPAAAWQESCWRQFEKKGGKVTYIRSHRGAVGMLQVSERVWRGFYDRDKLRWAVAYNVQAGSEVMYRYYELASGVVPAITRDSRPTAARAIYAAYNGGPSQLRAYLDAKRRGRGLSRVIDKLFGAKFDAAGDGIEGKVAGCLGGSPAG